MRQPLHRYVLRDPRAFLAFGFGSGLAPKAPGTFGTLAAIPLWWLLAPLPLWLYLLLTLLLFVVGVWLCEVVSHRLGVHDHPGIVWDEIVGLLLTMAFAPAEWHWLVVGFLLFRLFDITKPWPIGAVDRRVGGGFGIMVDDILAALYAGALLWLAVWFMPM